MKRALIIIGIIVIVSLAINNHLEIYNHGQSSVRPSDLLHFQPVCKGSDPNDVRIAQAELCRHELYFGDIDGKCGKQTALAICELLVKIQNGYKIRTIYEKRQSGD